MFQGRKQAEKIESAVSQANSLQQSLRLLKDRLDHHTHLIEAMWELVKTRTGATQEDLRQIVQKLESQEADGERQAEACPACSRPLQDNSRVCIYCGAETQAHRRLFR